MTFYLDNYLKASTNNTTFASVKMLTELSNGDTIKLSPRRYDFYSDGAFESFYYISNNDSGEKQIAFRLKDLKNVTIDGCGALLVFHGRILPFVIDSVQNVIIKNLTIDYESPFFAQAEIVEAEENSTVIKFDGKEFNARVKNGNFCFYSKEDNWENESKRCLVMEFDKDRRAPSGYKPPYFPYTDASVNKGFNSHMFKDVTLSEMDNNIIKINGSVGFKHTVGNYWVCTHGTREYPGIFITDSKDVYLENITLHHTTSMGVICQLSENIFLNKVIAEVADGSNRMMCVNADATHFVNCRGKIEISHSRFISMMDDAVNIHGIYTKFYEKTDNKAMLVTFGHHQQKGINPYKKGDKIRIIDYNTLDNILDLYVINSELISADFIKIETDVEIPDICGDFVIENLSTAPQVYIHHCESGNNRPRGFLLSSAGKTIVENCVFYNMNQGVQIGGEMKDWYESGAVNDVTIRNNEFKNSAYAGGAAIVISPKVKNPEKAVDFHKNIAIENNRFTMHEKRFIIANGIKNLYFKNNSYRCDTNLPPHLEMSNGGIRVSNCSDSVVEQLSVIEK